MPPACLIYRPHWSALHEFHIQDKSVELSIAWLSTMKIKAVISTISFQITENLEKLNKKGYWLSSIFWTFIFKSSIHFSTPVLGFISISLFKGGYKNRDFGNVLQNLVKSAYTDSMYVFTGRCICSCMYMHTHTHTHKHTQ